MDAILFRTHKVDGSVLISLEALKSTKNLNADIFVVYDATDREPFPNDLGVPIFNFTIEDYEKSGYPLATLDQIYELPTPTPLGSRSGPIYFNPEYAQLLWWKKHKGKYENIWYLEADVNFTGDWAYFFDKCSEIKTDLLATNLRQYPFLPSFKRFWDMVEFEVQDMHKFAFFGPIWRGSERLFEILDLEYKSGKHAFYELAVPTLAIMNDLTVSDINAAELFYHPFTMNGKFICEMWSKDFVLRNLNKLFHPVEFPPKSLLFATGHIADEKQIDRYERYINYYKRKGNDLGVFNIAIIDDGSPKRLVNKLKKRIPELEIIDAEKLPEKLNKPINWIRFKKNVGRPDTLTTAGWWRSFAYAGIIAKKYMYDKIIHLESDTYVFSDRMFEYLNKTKDGWMVVQSKYYNFPDTCIQVIQRRHFNTLEMIYNKGESFWFKARTNDHFIAEFVLPFTDIITCFKGDRYTDDICWAIPPDADYASNLGDMNIEDNMTNMLKKKYLDFYKRIGEKEIELIKEPDYKKVTHNNPQNDKSGKTAYHSGDLGDVIYAIPTFKKLNVRNIILNPKPDYGSKMDYKLCAALSTLLNSQGFNAIIDGNAKKEDLGVDYDFDYFRRTGQELTFTHLSLAQAMAMEVDIDLSEQFIFIDEPLKIADIIVNYTDRYHNNNFNQWKELLGTYDSVAFVGLADEYNLFVKNFKLTNIRYCKTSSIYELSRVIAGCKVFIGNQSMPFAIAEGLKKTRIQEVDVTIPNCIPHSHNALTIYSNKQLDIAKGFIYYYLKQA